MNNYDYILSELRTKLARKKHLESILPDMQSQKVALEQKLKTLETSKRKEEHDVEKIEGGSLASFFYNVVGKKDEKLDKERREAYEARVKYDLAASELAALESDIASIELKLDQLSGCDIEYQKVFNEKLEYMKATDIELCGKLQELEETRAFVEEQKVEIQEAIFAGQQALIAAKEAMENMDDAEGWSNWDMFGGGLLVDIAKHGALDDAQTAIEILQTRLRRFKTELADITIHTELNVRVEGFLHFADFFFDGIFVDWIVRDKIHSSIESLQSTRNQINNVLLQLKEMQQRATSKEMDLTRQIEELVLPKA